MGFGVLQPLAWQPSAETAGERPSSSFAPTPPSLYSLSHIPSDWHWTTSPSHAHSEWNPIGFAHAQSMPRVDKAAGWLGKGSPPRSIRNCTAGEGKRVRGYRLQWHGAFSGEPTPELPLLSHSLQFADHDFAIYRIVRLELIRVTRDGRTVGKRTAPRLSRVEPRSMPLKRSTLRALVGVS